MKISVLDKQERLVLGSTYELRGNFEEVIGEDGEVSYVCDMYRTMNGSKTFDSLHRESIRNDRITYLTDTKYVSDNYDVLLKVDEVKAKEYLNSISGTYNITVQEILEKRAKTVEEIATF